MVWKDNALLVGFFLAVREIKRSNPWTSILIILIISLTFFNMLFIGGLFLGIIGGFLGAFQTNYSGNVLISPAINKNEISDTDTVISIVKSLPTYRSLSARFVTSAILAYNYQNKVRPTDVSESAAGQLVGINPIAEDRTAQLSKAIIAGSYLTPSDSDEILVGSTLTQKYATVRNAGNTVGSRVLVTADIGSRVLLMVNGIQKEVTIKGIVTTNVPTVDARIYMVDSTVRQLMGNTSLNANEIAISLTPRASDTDAKNYIIRNLANRNDVLVQTSADTLPAGLSSELQIFSKLDNLIGGIALVISSITIFIVIYVNAVTRRKFIGILKGIGISSRAIEISYVFQALFYAIGGTILASVLIMGLIVPYYDVHPFNIAGIPGTLAITMSDIIPRAILLTVVSGIFGFIPAWLVTKQNTLDAILGR
ncbi:MAG TPA: FtsX-like permease family protein [Patescibacteria group bacterium]|nr:FtsX-like permease family protein [Patescibacteria group bacterium]